MKEHYLVHEAGQAPGRLALGRLDVVHVVEVQDVQRPRRRPRHRAAAAPHPGPRRSPPLPAPRTRLPPRPPPDPRASPISIPPSGRSGVERPPGCAVAATNHPAGLRDAGFSDSPRGRAARGGDRPVRVAGTPGGRAGALGAGRGGRGVVERRAMAGGGGGRGARGRGGPAPRGGWFARVWLPACTHPSLIDR